MTQTRRIELGKGDDLAEAIEDAGLPRYEEVMRPWTDQAYGRPRQVIDAKIVLLTSSVTVDITELIQGDGMYDDDDVEVPRTARGDIEGRFTGCAWTARLVGIRQNGEHTLAIYEIE